MKYCETIVLALNCVGMVLAAAALDYPVYTVMTSGEGTTSLASAQVEVVSAEGAAPETVAFSSLTFTGGKLDTRGSDITVPVLEGVNGVVTNSNAYFPGGSLTVGQKWMISGPATANKTLKVSGKLKFAAGSVLEGTDLALLSHKTEHTLAAATDGIEGMPAFDDDAPGNKGWHLVKETVNGVESLKLFWQRGMTISIH